MDVVVGAEAEGARRATGDSGPMTTSRATAPDPEVPAKVTRRRVSVEYRRCCMKDLLLVGRFGPPFSSPQEPHCRDEVEGSSA